MIPQGGIRFRPAALVEVTGLVGGRRVVLCAGSRKPAAPMCPTCGKPIPIEDGAVAPHEAVKAE